MTRKIRNATFKGKTKQENAFNIQFSGKIFLKRMLKQQPKKKKKKSHSRATHTHTHTHHTTHKQSKTYEEERKIENRQFSTLFMN